MENKNLRNYINQECKKIQFKNLKDELKFKAKLEKTFLKYLEVYHARALVKDNPGSKEFKKQNKRFNKIRFELYDLVGKLIDKPREPKTAIDYFLEKSGETLTNVHKFLEKDDDEPKKLQSPYSKVRIKLNEMWDAYIKDAKSEQTDKESTIPTHNIAPSIAIERAKAAGKKRILGREEK